MSRKKPKILIVDNEIEICTLFKDFFDFIGYESTFQTDGELILRELDKMEYDLLFVDLKLDTISGIEIVKKSKKVHPISEIIVVTGFGSEDSVTETLHYGASSYIQKPISFSDIRIQTEQALARNSFNTMTDKIKKAISSESESMVKHFDNILKLDRLTAFLNLSIDINALGDSILAGTADILPGKYYTFFFYDKINREMVFYSRDTISKKTHKSLEGRVKTAFEKLSNKEVESTYNVRISRAAPTSDKDAEIQAENLSDIFIPILMENSICGILGISGAPEDILEDTEEILSLISNRIEHVLTNAALHRDTKLLALTDGLTGLLNHRAFHERLKQEFARFRRYGSCLSLIVADLDDLKVINDTYGHPVGDEVLRKIGQCLQEASRENDVLARYGGDEFVVLLPQINIKNTLTMAERIRVKINESLLKVNEDQILSSVSMGISAVPQIGIETPQDFLESADRALYIAKRAGKNRIEVAT
jgi:diguanylate cyclase (GGDEF)-like protein